MNKGRSTLASVVGWILAIVVAWWLLGMVLGSLRWVIRSVLIFAVVIGLLWAYLALKAPDDD